MGDIDVGTGAINDSNSTQGGNTIIAIGNPANDTGTITSVSVYVNSGAPFDAKVGSFSGSGSTYECMDYDTVTLSDNGLNTKDCSFAINSGEYIGIWWDSTFDYIDCAISGGDNLYTKSGDQTEAGPQTFTLLSGDNISISGSGTSTPVSSSAIFINIGDSWKNIATASIIISGAWATIF